MEWGGKKGVQGNLTEWKKFGTMMGERNYYYYVLRNVSHMAPYDGPASCRAVYQEMLERNHVALDQPSKIETGKNETKHNSGVDDKVPNTGSEKSQKPNKPATDGTKPSNDTLHSSTPPKHAVKKEPSHLAAGLFLLGFFFVALFGGLYVRRKISRIPEKKWYLIVFDYLIYFFRDSVAEDEEEIEMQETEYEIRNYPNRKGHYDD